MIDLILILSMKDKTPKIKTHTHTLTHTYTNADTTLLSDAYTCSSIYGLTIYYHFPENITMETKIHIICLFVIHFNKLNIIHKFHNLPSLSNKNRYLCTCK